MTGSMRCSGPRQHVKAGNQMPAEVYAREFVHPDDAHLVADEVKRSIAATDPNYTRQIEHRIIRRDGEIRHINVRIAITKDAEGRTVKTHGANQDITERKQAEEKIRKAQQEIMEHDRFLQRLIDTIPNPVFYKDKNGIYTGSNTAFEEYIGLTKDQLIGKSVYDIAPKDLADIYYAD